MVHELSTLISIHWAEVILRGILAIFFGFCIGYDRDKKDKPVDFRVYMIVALTTCLLIIMGEELIYRYNTEHDQYQLGLMRIVQGVLTGIGFLGAGAIIKTDNKHVIGSTTGASIWASGAIGMMLGFGMYILSIIMFVFIFIILVMFGLMKKPLFDEKENEK